MHSFRNPRGPQEVLTPIVDAVRQEGVEGLLSSDGEFSDGYGELHTHTAVYLQSMYKYKYLTMPLTTLFSERRTGRPLPDN